MAMTLQIPGPTVVKIDGTTIGMSDNDNLPSVAFTDNYREVKTVASGDAPVEVVLTNTTAVLSFTLVSWDESELQSLLVTQRGAYGTTTVGRRLVANSGVVEVTIESVSGAGQYVFSTCYLRNDGISDSQWGNRERTLTLNFNAIPDPTTNNLFTYTG